MNATAAGILLDNNASTPLVPAALAAMVDCLAHVHGNPSSQHGAGQAAKAVLARGRAAVAALVGAAPSELVFTGSATEANHLAILGVLDRSPARRRIVTSTVEHPATQALLADLEARGSEVVRVGVDRDGALDLEGMRAAIDRDTALVSLMWANNETGVCFPVEAVADWTRAAGALFHCDAVQAAGRVPIDVHSFPVDLMSLSAHKLHGPKGVGALYVRKSVNLTPLVRGHQERRRHGGTENLPGIAGFGAAAEAALAAMASAPAAIAVLRDTFEQTVLSRHSFARIIGSSQPRVCNTSSVRFAGCSADELLERLDRAGIWASGGAACASGGGEPSQVLLAMGHSREDALATVRFSLSRLTTAAELARAADQLSQILPAANARRPCSFEECLTP